MKSRNSGTVKQQANAVGQLSLVEHALCQLDPRSSAKSTRFDTEYRFYDANGNQQTASVTLHNPMGLTANDEFFLWGLLALTCAETNPGIEFWATPHYILKRLGCSHKPGGKDHRIFRAALRRLAAVNYESDQFYDPIRQERCAVSFGFLSYQLPLDPGTSRAWRIVWDPVFFDFCLAAGGSFRFDLDVYRSLDCGTRRLFLLLRKVFHRRQTSQRMELRHLAVNILGFSPSIPTFKLREKVLRCAARLCVLGIIQTPRNASGLMNCITKQGKGLYSIKFERGPNFAAVRGIKSRERVQDSRFYEQLKRIGFEDSGIARTLGEYKPHLLERWIDVTLIAIERFGPPFFRRSPQAFLIDNLKNAAMGTRSAPDWYHELRKHEETRRKPELRKHESDAFEDFLTGQGRRQFESVVKQMLRHLHSSGQSSREAKSNAEQFAREHMRKRFSSSNVTNPTHISKLLQ